MLTRTNTIRSAVAAGVVGSVLAVGTPIAFASAASADTEKRGSCSKGDAIYDFEVDKDDGRYEVNFEVDSNVDGERWRVRLYHEGNRFYSSVNTTDNEGEADVEANRPNTRGKDHFKVTALNLRSGETCSAKIVRKAG